MATISINETIEIDMKTFVEMWKSFDPDWKADEPLVTVAEAEEMVTKLGLGYEDQKNMVDLLMRIRNYAVTDEAKMIFEAFIDHYCSKTTSARDLESRLRGDYAAASVRGEVNEWRKSLGWRELEEKLEVLEDEALDE